MKAVLKEQTRFYKKSCLLYVTLHHYANSITHIHLVYTHKKYTDMLIYIYYTDIAICDWIYKNRPYWHKK